jgi:hypothetical protein
VSNTPITANNIEFRPNRLFWFIDEKLGGTIKANGRNSWRGSPKRQQEKPFEPEGKLAFRMKVIPRMTKPQPARHAQFFNGR